VNLHERFVAAVAQAYGRLAGPELLPLVLAEACATVLAVDGAGLSLTGQLRIPLAASNDHAISAERLQTTLGDGPCLTAAANSTPVLADDGTLADRWPMFHQELTEQTPFRSVASLPLQQPGRVPFGALDLYSAQPDANHLHQLATDTANIADQIALTLLAAPTTDDEDGGQAYTWLATTPATVRRNVWIAIGMLLVHRRITNHDALSILRGYALSHQTTLDDVAQQLTERQLSPENVLL